MKIIIPLLLLILVPTALAEVHGMPRDMSEDGLEKLAYSIYAFAASIVIASMIIANAIKGRGKRD